MLLQLLSTPPRFAGGGEKYREAPAGETLDAATLLAALPRNEGSGEVKSSSHSKFPPVGARSTFSHLVYTEDCYDNCRQHFFCCSDLIYFFKPRP